MKKLLLFGLLLLGGFALLACDLETTRPPDMTDQEKVDDAAGRIIALFPSRGDTRGSLTLPQTMIHGVVVTWESSDESIITNEGRVIRPAAEEGNAYATMTATLTLGEGYAQVSVNFVVIPLPAGLTFYDDFGLLHAESSLNDDILAEGVVVHVFAAGYFLYDGENYFGVYKPNHNVVSLGDRVQVLGTYSVYNTLYQLGSVVNEEVIDSGHPTDVPVEELTIAQINALDTAANRLIPGRVYKTQGQVQLKGAFDNVYLVDGDDDVLVYYLSLSDSIDALESFVGQIIELEIVYYTDHSRDGVMVVFQGGLDDISIVEVDEEAALNTDIASAAATPNYTFGEDVVLPEYGALGTAFTNWTSSHPELIANDGTFVAEPLEPTLVTFTGTATMGAFTDTATVTVDALAMMTIAEANEVEANKHVMVEGVIYQFVPGNSGFFIYDGTGYTYIRDTTLYATLSAAYNVGDVISMVGVRDNYRGIPQLAAIKMHETSTSTYDAPENVGTVDIADIGAGVYPAGTIVTVTGLTTVITGRFTDYRLYDDTAFVQIHHNSNNALFLPFDGTIVTAEVIVFQWDYFIPYVLFFGTADDILEEEMSDVDKVAIAKAELDLGDTSMVVTDLVLPSTGSQGTTITWVSLDHDALLDDGTIIRGPVDVTVTLVATITLNDVVETKEFTIVVKDETFGAMSVADALLEDNGTTVIIEAVVHSINETRFGVQGYFIQDLDGTAIYLNNELTEDLEVGNKVIVQGVLETYASFGNAQRRLASAGLMLIANDEGSHAVVIVDDASISDIVNAYPASSSVRYRVENVVISEYDGFNAIFFVTGETMRIKFDARDYVTYFKDLYEVGDTIPWIEFTVYDIHFSNIRVVDVVLPELTDAQIETLLENAAAIPAEVTADVTLLETVTIEGVEYTITWASDNLAVIALDGTVTRPAFGEVDEVVTLTATVMIGIEEAVLTFVVTVPAYETEPSDETVAYSTGFEDSTAKTSYADGTITTDGKDWRLEQALRGNLADDKKNGDFAIRGRQIDQTTPGYAEMLFGFEHVTRITFHYANYGSLTDGRIALLISNDEGVTWTEIWVQAETQATLTLVDFVIDYDALTGIDFGDEVRFMFTFTGTTGTQNNSRLNLDDVTIYTEVPEA